MFISHVFPQHCPALHSQLTLWLPSTFLPVAWGTTCLYCSTVLVVYFTFKNSKYYFHNCSPNHQYVNRLMISTIWSSTSATVSSEFSTTSMAQTNSSGYSDSVSILLSTSVSHLKSYDVSGQSKQGLRQTHHSAWKQTTERNIPR